jgi:hypothetical protein
VYCISRSANLTLPIRDRKVHYHPVNGEIVKVDEALSVQFKHAGSVPPYAREAVQRLANWGVGLGHNEDPFSRCGAVDTEVEKVAQGWSDDEHSFVCEALRNSQSSGIEFVIVEAPPIAKPFPKYDDIVGEQAAEQIAFYADELGIDPGQIKLYEQENLDREDVIARMDALIEKQNEDIVEVISA